MYYISTFITLWIFLREMWKQDCGTCCESLLCPLPPAFLRWAFRRSLPSVCFTCPLLSGVLEFHFLSNFALLAIPIHLFLIFFFFISFIFASFPAFLIFFLLPPYLSSKILLCKASIRFRILASQSLNANIMECAIFHRAHTCESMGHVYGGYFHVLFWFNHLSCYYLWSIISSRSHSQYFLSSLHACYFGGTRHFELCFVELWVCWIPLFLWNKNSKNFYIASFCHIVKIFDSSLIVLSHFRCPNISVE